MANEKGTVLSLTLTLALIISTLLLTLSQQLQSQSLLYEKRRSYQVLTLLEKECVQLILNEITDPTIEIPVYNSSKTIILSNGSPVTLKYANYTQTLDVTYQVYYNEYLGKGKLSYQKDKQTYTLNHG